MEHAFIVDYKVGNFESLQNKYRLVTGAVPQLIQNADGVKPGDHLLLSGVAILDSR